MPKPSTYILIKLGFLSVNNRSPLDLRFWAGVDKQGPIHPTYGQCWQWTRHRFISGYGRIMMSRKLMKAHRVSWILHNGEIPESLLVLHHCDNKACVNPAHLFLGTNFDNSLDRVEKGQHSRGIKLTPEQVREIRRRYRPRSPISGNKQLAKEFGITQVMVTNIVTRRSWGHIF